MGYQSLGAALTLLVALPKRPLLAHLSYCRAGETGNRTFVQLRLMSGFDDGLRFRQASPSTYRPSVAGCGQPREKRRVCREPAGYELGEEPHSLRLARLSLREKPERPVHV